MANNPNRTYKVSVAAPAQARKFDMSKTHICTNDFGVLKSIDCRLFIPGDKMHFEVSQFTRLMPMPVPTYGDVKSITRMFVVPINDVMSNFGEFVSKNFSAGRGVGSTILYPPQVPWVSTYHICELFLNINYGFVHTVRDIDIEVDVNQFDTLIRVDEAAFKGVKFTWLGRKVVSWLHGLGLNWRWSTYTTDTMNISMLPILCWWKFYLDWIVPSRFVPEFIFVRHSLGVNYTSQNSDFFLQFCSNDAANFAKFFTPVSVYYNDDYFTNAFIEAYGPEQSFPTGAFNYNSSGQVNSLDETIPSAVASPVDGSILSNSSEDYLNRFSLTSLCVLQDMLNRSKLAGTKVQDYLLTTYGIKPNDDVLHISKYIGSHRNTIQIGDIKATATTETNIGGSSQITHLGQYAGQAIGGNVDSFDFGDFEEHAYIFITNELSIKPSYTQGTHIEWTALKHYDFYDGSWDGKGVRMIPFSELASDMDWKQFYVEGLGLLPAINKPFGYTPIFSEHKQVFDIVSGDFRFGSLNTGLDSWYLNRKIDRAYIENNGDYINRKFCEQVSDSESYDRIFVSANNDSDHFYSVFNIDCTAYRHMLSLTDALETESDDEGHKTVGVDFQGSVNS